MKRQMLVLAGVLVVLLSGVLQAGWIKNYGGPDTDRGYAIRLTADGGYIVTGFYGMKEPVWAGDIYLLKLDAQGNVSWEKVHGRPGETDWDYGEDGLQTADGGYLVVGTVCIDQDFGYGYVLKTNAQGDTVWSRLYGSATGYYQDFYSVEKTADGGYILAGETDGVGVGDAWLVKLNSAGDTLWTRTYGPGTLSMESAQDCQLTADGGYILAGYTTHTDTANHEQAWLIKTNSSGDTLWTRTYGGADNEWANSVKVTSDGGYIFTGATYSFGNNAQVYLVKTNAAGNALWSKTYGGQYEDYGSDVQLATGGGYIITGRTKSFGNNAQVWLIRTNGSGDTLWTKRYGGTADDEGLKIQPTQDGGYIIAGRTVSYGNAEQVYVIKIDSLGSAAVETPLSRLDGLTVGRLTANPNPFTSFTLVPGHEKESYSLFDISGRKVGVYQGDRVGFDLGPGVYFLKPSNSDAKPVRVVKVR